MPTSDLDLPLLPSAEQIRRREFASVRRGYDPDQVRDYLEAVASQVETLEKDLKDTVLHLESKVAEPAVAASRTSTESTADPYDRISKRFAGLLATADREASRLVDEAKTEADRVVIEAKTQADRMRVDAQSRAEADRQQGHGVLEKARDEADRVLAGLSSRRELVVDQLKEMQVRLVSVAKDIEVVASAPPAEGETAGTVRRQTGASAGSSANTGGGDDPVDPRYEDLWVPTEGTAEDAIDVSDLASIELDFDQDRPDTET